MSSTHAQQQDPAPPDANPLVPEAVFKPGSGLSFATADNMFALTVGLRLQFLYTLNQHSDPDPGQDLWTHALELRRGRATMNGHVFGKHNRYRVQFHYGPREVSGGEGEVRLSALCDGRVTSIRSYQCIKHNEKLLTAFCETLGLDVSSTKSDPRMAKVLFLGAVHALAAQHLFTPHPKTVQSVNDCLIQQFMYSALAP